MNVELLIVLNKNVESLLLFRLNIGLKEFLRNSDFTLLLAFLLIISGNTLS